MDERGAPPVAAVLTVGDELLLGRNPDTNAVWLSRFLGRLGCRVRLRATVGDDEGAIADAVLQCLERAELVVVTGGLGPTTDDRTRQGVSRALDRPLELHAELEKALEDRARARGLERLPEPSRSQALVPRAAQILPNPVGSAPGLLLTEGTRRLFLLPGVPREMRVLAREELAARVKEALGARLRPRARRRIYTAGLPESAVAERVGPELPETDEVHVSFLPRLYGVELLLTAEVGREGEAALERVEARLRTSLKDALVHVPSGDLADAVGRALSRKGLRVAVAESCTGGLVGRRLTDVSGSSAYFEGGVIAYADAVKVEVLGVHRDLIRRMGAVSREVAEAMAYGARERFSTEAAVAVTGVAGPGGGSAEKPVGTVWIAAAVEGRVRSRLERFPGRRDEIRERSAEAALELTYRLLTEEE